MNSPFQDVSAGAIVGAVTGAIPITLALLFSPSLPADDREWVVWVAVLLLWVVAGAICAMTEYLGDEIVTVGCLGGSLACGLGGLFGADSVSPSLLESVRYVLNCFVIGAPVGASLFALYHVATEHGRKVATRVVMAALLVGGIPGFLLWPWTDGVRWSAFGTTVPHSTCFYDFESQGRPPVGPVVTMAFDVREGDAFTLRSEIEGGGRSGTRDSGQTSLPALDFAYHADFRCDQVLPNGDIGVKVEFKEFELRELANGTTGGGRGEFKSRTIKVHGLEGRLLIDKDQKRQETTVVDLKPELQGPREAIRRVLLRTLRDDFKLFVPFPKKGARVGEAFDAKDTFAGSAEFVKRIHEDVDERWQGEFVLEAVRTVEGVSAAELGVNFVGEIEGEFVQQGFPVRVAMGLKIEGRQFRDLRTGFPVGRSEIRIMGRGVLSVDGDPEELHLDLTVRTTALPTKSAEASSSSRGSVRLATSGN